MSSLATSAVTKPYLGAFCSTGSGREQPLLIMAILSAEAVKIAAGNLRMVIFWEITLTTADKLIEGVFIVLRLLFAHQYLSLGRYRYRSLVFWQEKRAFLPHHRH